MDLSNRVLMHFEGLKLLSEATIEELTAIKGIGIAKGVSVLAALELGKRVNQYQPEERYTVKSPEDGADFVMEEMRSLKQEHLVALFLNTKNQIIHRQTIFIGSRSEERRVGKDGKVHRSAYQDKIKKENGVDIRMDGKCIV